MDCRTPHSSDREREVNDRRDGCVTRQNPAVVGWEDIRKIALSLPEAEEEPGDRPAFRVRGKLFAWKSRDRDGGTLALRVDRDEKQLMLDLIPTATSRRRTTRVIPACSYASTRSMSRS